jgi:hypothetical protein
MFGFGFGFGIGLGFSVGFGLEIDFDFDFDLGLVFVWGQGVWELHPVTARGLGASIEHVAVGSGEMEVWVWSFERSGVSSRFCRKAFGTNRK